MYAGRVGDRNLTFVVSGMLWQRSLVMKDLETGSLWSHLLGEAMRGPLKGERLRSLPSAMTDWKTWRAQHPDTTVLKLSRTSVEYRREFYRDPSKFVIGLADGAESRAWPLDQLTRQPVVNDQFRRTPVLVVYMQESATALIYSRRVGERTLTFVHENGKLFDQQTRSQWDPASGKAVAGLLQGSRLTPQVGIVSYRRAWRDFHPDSLYWTIEARR